MTPPAAQFSFLAGQMGSVWVSGRANVHVCSRVVLSCLYELPHLGDQAGQCRLDL